MDVNTIEFRLPGAHVADQRKRLPQGEHAPDLGGHATDHGEYVPDPLARVTVSRARVVLAFLRAETLTAVNAVSQSGLMAAGGVLGRARSRIPSQAGSRF